MNINELKKKAAFAALKYVCPGTVIGIGTGSTIFYFIEALNTIKHLIYGVVSSSDSSTILLKKKGIKVLNVSFFHSIKIYFDSADEINQNMQMIKGGGAALTKEKIIAAMAETFICILDVSKQVNILGHFPLPIEIIPIAISYISKEIVKLGGIPKCRKNTITENGNIIIDIHNLHIKDPIFIEKKLNSWPGVVTVGLFALRGADIALVGTKNGVNTLIK